MDKAYNRREGTAYQHAGSIPDSFDWRTEKVVSKIKNQGKYFWTFEKFIGGGTSEIQRYPKFRCPWKSKFGSFKAVLPNLRISSNLESDASIRNRIFRIFDSNRRIEIRRFESEYGFEVRDSVRIRFECSRFDSTARKFNFQDNVVRVGHLRRLPHLNLPWQLNEKLINCFRNNNFWIV